MIRKAFNLNDDASLIVRLPSQGILVPYEVTSITVTHKRKRPVSMVSGEKRVALVVKFDTTEFM